MADIARAAGVIACSPSGRCLMVHRTDGEGWAFPGGGMKDGEDEAACAWREFFEETGYRLGSAGRPHMRRVKDGVDFTTFICECEDEFVPKLNHEHDAYAWIHPRLILEEMSGIAPMNPPPLKSGPDAPSGVNEIISDSAKADLRGFKVRCDDAKIKASCGDELAFKSGLVNDAAFNEEDHPRDEDGKFSGYHGSPRSGIAEDFSNFESDIAFFSKNRDVAHHYANVETMAAQRGGRGTPTIYEVSGDVGKTFDMRKPEHRALYAEARKAYNAEHEDPDYHLPSLKSEGFIMSNSGLPGFGPTRAILPMMAKHGFGSMALDEGTQGESLAVYKPQGRMKAQAESAEHDVYHGTTHEFSDFEVPEFDHMPDRMLGVHVAKDPAISTSFVENFAYGMSGPETRAGGRVIPMKLKERKFMTVPQKRYESGSLETDQRAVAKMINVEAYKAEPAILTRYLVEARNMPLPEAQAISKRLVAGETVPMEGREYDLDGFVDSYGGTPYNEADKKRVVKLARDEWAKQGFQGLKYENTSPMETRNAKDKTCFIVFDPKELKGRFADAMSFADVAFADAILSRLDGPWKEELHPRGEGEHGGEFVKKGASGGGHQLQHAGGGSSKGPPAKPYVPHSGSKTGHPLEARGSGELPRPAGGRKYDTSRWSLGTFKDAETKRTKDGKTIVIGEWRGPGGRKLEGLKPDTKVPPGLFPVWINPDKTADMIGYGQAANKKWQPIMRHTSVEASSEDKFVAVRALAPRFKSVWNANEANRKSKNERTRAYADVYGLIMHLGIRPGDVGEETKTKTKTYGATGLLGKHVIESKGKVSLRFVPMKKHASTNKETKKIEAPEPETFEIDDPGLAKMLLERKKAAGPNGKLTDTNDRSLRDYVKTCGTEMPPKYMRTLRATTLGHEYASKVPKPKTKREWLVQQRAVASAVAAKINNTWTMCRDAYIDPQVWTKAWGKEPKE